MNMATPATATGMQLWLECAGKMKEGGGCPQIEQADRPVEGPGRRLGEPRVPGVCFSRTTGVMKIYIKG